MHTKTLILRFFESRLPEYVFDCECRPNLLFRKRLSRGLYEAVAIQRDSKSNALAPRFAVTYNPRWQGEPASPLGIARGLPQLHGNQEMVDAIEYWCFYQPNREGLIATLEAIHTDFQKLAVPFFEWAHDQLSADKLLQTALQAAGDIPAEARVDLTEALEAVGHLLSNCKHPAYLAVRERIRSVWSDDIPREHRGWTNRLAYDVLAYL